MYLFLNPLQTISEFILYPETNIQFTRMTMQFQSTIICLQNLTRKTWKSQVSQGSLEYQFTLRCDKRNICSWQWDERIRLKLAPFSLFPLSSLLHSLQVSEASWLSSRLSIVSLPATSSGKRGPCEKRRAGCCRGRFSPLPFFFSAVALSQDGYWPDSAAV